MLHVGWSHQAKAPGRVTVYPDGCRDVIVVEAPDRAPHLIFSDWDDRPRVVDVTAGMRMTGFRLRPGLTLSPDALAELAGEEARTAAFLGDRLDPVDDMAEIVELLAGSALPLARIARRFGVSPRTLQRRFHEKRLPAPDFWRRLGRARRAAAALADDTPLAAVAASLGYSDQAHMTRDCLAWFGQSPARLRRDEAARAILAQPGLGNWAGVRISMR